MVPCTDQPLQIAILSGGTGRTASQVVNAALAQFERPHVRLLRFNQIATVPDVRRIIRELPAGPLVIFHSLVSPAVSEAAVAEAKRRMIPAVDILGRALAALSDHLGVEPLRQPGLSYQLQKEQFDRIDAVSYTLEHDDGAGLSTLSGADVVLVGVSRASKSVTCFYLAYRGVRAANVPLIPSVRVPNELIAMPPARVIGLTVSPQRLRAIREARRSRLGAGVADYYVGANEIADELRYALKVFRKHSWKYIDVSYMAVEEVAVQVLHDIGQFDT
jgi:regulator of PEP synthase PpsR (kinase-PPPase family)